MGHLLTLSCVTVNSLDPRRLASFWGELLDAPPTDSGNGFIAVSPSGAALTVLFQPATVEPDERGWIHLDCRSTDREAAIERIVGLGGRLVERRSDSSGSWVVMADPDGNPFCL